MAEPFDLSARITADASGLVQAGSQGEAAIESIGEAAKKAAQPAKALETATAGVAQASGKAADAAARETAQRLRAETAAVRKAAAEKRLEAATSAAGGSATRAAAESARLAEAESKAARAAAAAELAELRLARARERSGASNKPIKDGLNEATAAANRNAFGLRNLGQQFGDFATQVSLGGGVVRAFASQAGQAGYALSEMGGKAGAVGKFLTGPWGIALTVAAVALAPFVEQLFETGKAADNAKVGVTGLSDAQGALGEIFDLTTGKLKKQNAELATSNELLRLNARLTAINLRRDALQESAAADKAFGRAGTISGKDRAGSAASGFFSAPSLSDPLAGGVTGGIRGAIRGSERGRANAKNLRDIVAGVRSGRYTPEAALRASEGLDFTGSGLTREDFQQAIINRASSAAKLDIARLTDKSLNDGTLATPLRRTAKAKKPKSTAAVEEFGRDAADKLASIREGLDDTPSLVASTNKQLRQLDDLIDDLARKKPRGFDKLIADAKALKPLVTDSLNRPYREFIASQERSLEIDRLVAAGRTDEAEALKTIQSLELQGVKLNADQKDAILATVQARRAETRELEKRNALNAKYLEALGSVKTAVEDATQAFVRGDLGQFIKTPGKLLDAFQTLQGRQIFDKLFAGIFSDLQDEINGTSVVKDASDRMAKAVDKAAASIGKLGAAADSAAGRVAGTPAGGGGSTVDPATGDIVVEGRRNPVVTAIGKVASTIGEKLGIKDPKAFGATIGRYAGRGLEGAATGSIVSGVGKALGLKLSSTGSQIGGALGGLTGIPGASIVGSLAGGLIGGLFKKTTKGGVSITGTDAGDASYSGSGKLASALTGNAATVQDQLKQISGALGATLGAFGVSIGKNGDYYHVSGSANGDVSAKHPKIDVLYEGKDEATAIAIAVQNAIQDGAVKGLSAAVQKALSSSADTNAALAEALKVREVETLIGGLGASLKAQFEAFDATAKDRIRIATQYGLDVAQVEKLNAEQRTKLVDDTLKTRIGGLSDFLNSLTFGDLAEGSAAEKLAALNVQIAKAQTAAEAGTDGAADQLAQLLAQKVGLSRDSFGTAGGQYAGDRADAITAVERVIQMETDRVNAAAGTGQATTDAVNAVAEGVNETNDLLAQAVTGIRNLPAELAARLGLGGGSGADYSAVSRSVSLV